jgi:excisionase family DNA binding protein
VSTNPNRPAPANRTPLVVMEHCQDIQLYKVSDVMQILSLSRTVIFELLRSGRLRSVKQGRTRLIPASALREYIALLEKEAHAA